MRKEHPKIILWYWNQKILEDKKYLKDLERIAAQSHFNTVCATPRANRFWDPNFTEEKESVNFWDTSYADVWQEAVEHAHKLGLKLMLQVYAKGFGYPSGVDVSEALAIVTEHTAVVKNGKAVIRAQERRNRWPEYAPALESRVLCSVVMEPCGDGEYVPGSLQPIEGEILYKDPANLSLGYDLPDREGQTVYVIVAHYYRTPDPFGEASCRDYKQLMDAYRHIPFDGIVLDEYKSTILQNKDVTDFRERIYSKAFAEVFCEKTGRDLVQTMLEMRWCPRGQAQIRMAAINRYFDLIGFGPKKVERFVADYSRRIFGEDAFLGLHSTFHNKLQGDDVWLNGISWWDVPRTYAQTDEDIAYPIRMGIACQCPENLTYDMYYGWDIEKFCEKAVRDARFNSRIHYHATNDVKYGIDPMEQPYLSRINAIEEKVSLLNAFEPAMPKMQLLVVFGYPALCNWYPHPQCRNKWDINGALNIQKRVSELWNNGYHNALAPSQAVADGRIIWKDGAFDYCGNRFEKLLFLYPEYAKPEVLAFLQESKAQGRPLWVVGEITRDFEGAPVNAGLEGVTLPEDADIPQALKLTAEKVESGCTFADGSVIVTDQPSIEAQGFCRKSFPVDGHAVEAEFRGVLGIKLAESGEICKLAAGNLKELFIDGRPVLIETGEKDILLGI